MELLFGDDRLIYSQCARTDSQLEIDISSIFRSSTITMFCRCLYSAQCRQTGKSRGQRYINQHGQIGLRFWVHNVGDGRLGVIADLQSRPGAWCWSLLPDSRDGTDPAQGHASACDERVGSAQLSHLLRLLISHLNIWVSIFVRSSKDYFINSFFSI